MAVSVSAKDARNVNKSLFMSGEDLVFAKVPFLPQKQQMNTMIFLNNKKKTTNTINTNHAVRKGIKDNSYNLNN